MHEFLRNFRNWTKCEARPDGLHIYDDRKDAVTFERPFMDAYVTEDDRKAVVTGYMTSLNGTAPTWDGFKAYTGLTDDKPADVKPEPEPIPEPCKAENVPDVKPEPTPEPVKTHAVKHTASAAASFFDALPGAAEYLNEIVAARVNDKLKGAAVVDHIIKVAEFTTKIDGVILPAYFDTVLTCAANRLPVYMVGAAGCGKTWTAEQVAKAMNLPFFPVMKLSDEYELKGFNDAHGVYQPTPFYYAYRDGGVFFLDEMDASDANALTAINAALANGFFTFPKIADDGKPETVNVNKNFVCIAAGNTTGNGATSQYTGRNALDLATLDRFFTIPCDYDNRIELARADGDNALVEFIHDLRNACKAAHVDVILSYRCINTIKRLQLAGLNLADVMDGAILKGMDAADAQRITLNLKDTSGVFAAAFNKAVANLKKREAAA